MAHTAGSTSSGRTTAQAFGLLLAGAVAGGVLAVSFGALASSSSTVQPGPASYAATGNGPDGHARPGRPGPMRTGTVTAVGGKSVTIKSVAGTKTYAVDADSDIDKNGEAKVSDLKAGDAVRFAVRPGTSTIAVLHAGDEAKDRPAFGFGGPRGHHGPCPGMQGPGMQGPGGDGPHDRPAPSPSATTHA